jgi:phosphocarrier protein
MKQQAVTRELKILNQYGIHARPAALFVRMASRFNADIEVQNGEARVSGKSIMGLMTLQACCGSTLKVTADGVDAEAALDALEALVAGKFDED